ncbi:uncharacterized protein LOC142634442 [Castanea sativa]|uniref:uncharacterized protein LOC142634442 n=1 Tax=Castanea sativa TaxID=21020 RepID=UPI003F65324E
MKDTNEGAYFWLKGHTTTIWARHMFRDDGLSDTVLNNMYESFNNRVIKFREKPVISMLEDIRLYLMNRSQQNRLSIMKPPIKRRSPDKSKRKRVRKPNEPRRSHNKGLGIAKRCKSCEKIGHNKKSCKGEVGGNSSLPIGSGGGLDSRSSSPKQTTNKAHADGASGEVVINKPNPPRVPPTNRGPN